MSYILNALRKSEQDRKTQEAANPENDLLETQPKQSSNLSLFMLALIIINILGLIYFIYINMQKIPTNTIATAEKKKPAIVSPAQPEKRKIAVKTNIEPPKSVSIAPIKTQTTQKPIPKTEQKKTISKMLKQRHIFKKPASKPEVDNVVAVTKKTNSNPTIAPLSTKAKTKPVPVKQPPSQVDSKPEKARNIPFLREMAPSFRRNVPKLNINVFVYAENPNDRFVIIDMKKYRTGQETSEGMEIKEIKSNSLVLNYNNRTFQIERP
jgi:general secretion pathway protein B